MNNTLQMLSALFKISDDIINVKKQISSKGTYAVIIYSSFFPFNHQEVFIGPHSFKSLILNISQTPQT